MHRSVLLLLLVPLLLVAVPGCGESPDVSAPPDTGPVESRALELSASPWTPLIHTYGSFESAEEIDISVDIAATVNKVLFEEGRPVSVGTVLVEFDKKKLQLKYASMAAQVEEARAQFEQARSTFESNRAVYEKGVLSRQAFETSESSFKATRANLQRVRAAENLARQELADTQLRSPVDGVITERRVEPGQNVMPGASLGTIQGSDLLRVVTYVSEREVNLIRIGQVCPITTPGAPGREYEGRVELVGASALADTGNFTVRLTVDNSNGLLRAGMSARIALRGIEQDEVVLVPREAVVDRNRQRVVFRLDEGRARAVQVEPAFGIGNNTMVPVFAGLEAGDIILVSNLHLISDGQPVQAAVGEG